MGLDWKKFTLGIVAGALCGCGVQIRGLRTANVDSPALTWSGSSYAFGYVAVGANSSSTTFTLRNSGTLAATECSAPTLSNSADFSVVSDLCGTADLPGAGSTCAVAVRANPGATGTATTRLQRTCGTDASTVVVSDPITARGLSLAVSPRYAIAPDWNDYFRTATPTVACDGSETGFYGTTCSHGGELRSAPVDGATSCTGLTAADSLGVFRWVCDDSGGTATFYSTGLNDGKGLTDLLDATAFKTISLTVSENGTPVVSSTAATWWGNPVSAAPANGGGGATVVLTGAGTIYTVSASATSGGYNFNSDRMALVTLNGATLTYADGGANCDWTTGATTGGDRCLVVNRRNFFWLEGSYVGTGSNEVLMMTNASKFDRVRNIHAIDSSESTLYFWKGTGILVQNAVFAKTAVGIGMESNDPAAPNKFNIFQDVTVSHLSWTGIFDYYGSSLSEQNIFVGVRAVGISGDALSMGSGSKNSISHVTVLNTTGRAIHLASTNDTVSQAAFANVGTGLNLAAGGSHTIVENLAAGNVGTGVAVATTGNVFSGNLLVGNASTKKCSVPGANGGLVDTTCSDSGADGSSAYVGGGTASDALFRASAVDLTSAFVGKVSSQDGTNGSDTLGQAAYASITDWTYFANPFRGWGLDLAAFPDSTDRGRCGSGTCRIWDLRLAAADAVLRNRSGNGSTPNDAFVGDPSVSCPSAADGNVAVTDQMASPHTYLLNATELPGRGGNDNGLCESGETCVYSPNFGAYQGEGSLSASPCKFTDGTVTGVTLYGYSTNGT